VIFIYGSSLGQENELELEGAGIGSEELLEELCIGIIEDELELDCIGI